MDEIIRLVKQLMEAKQALDDLAKERDLLLSTRVRLKTQLDELELKVTAAQGLVNEARTSLKALL